MSGDIAGALKKLNADVLGRDGVSGTAVGGRKGAPCLVVYVRDKAARAGLPASVDGIPVRVEVSGSFRRL